jgi:hypothetical protein
MYAKLAAARRGDQASGAKAPPAATTTPSSSTAGVRSGLDGEAPTAFLLKNEERPEQDASPEHNGGRRAPDDGGAPAEENLPVFPGAASKSGHVRDLRKAWKKAKEQVGLSADLHLHDLRHSYASAVVSSGNSLCAS